MLFRTYPVCRVSGGLGPKTASGDLQAPEGLYALTLAQLNPRSRFYLSLNLGYPNAFEAARGWTGDALMIHGGCVSVGCYAHGGSRHRRDLHGRPRSLLAGRARSPVQALPFPLTPERLTSHAEFSASSVLGHPRTSLPPVRDEKLPPRITVLAGGYRSNLQPRPEGAQALHTPEG